MTLYPGYFDATLGFVPSVVGPGVTTDFSKCNQIFAEIFDRCLDEAQSTAGFYQIGGFNYTLALSKLDDPFKDLPATPYLGPPTDCKLAGEAHQSDCEEIRIPADQQLIDLAAANCTDFKKWPD